MTYPPQQPQGDWGGQQPYDPSQQGYGQPNPAQQGYNQQPPAYDPYAQPPVDPYQQPQQYSAPPVDPMQQYSAPPVSVTPASGQPWPGAGGPMLPPAPPKSGPPAWIFIVGGLTLLALIGVGVFFAVNAGGDDNPSDDKSDSAADKSDEPSDDPTSESAPPGGDLIQDPGTGLAFEPIDEWQTLDTSQGVPVKNFLSMGAQQYEVATDWVAMVGVGEVDTAAVDYKDSGDLKDAIKTVAKDYDSNNFGEDPKGFDRDQKAEYSEESIAGKDAMTMVYHLTWDEGENPDTGEQVVMALIDAGDGKVAGFIGSLPDSTPKDQVDAAVDSVKTLDFV
ncbi:MAG: hypothetical protein ACRD0P_04785 [Stackebrandtia sp.]